MTSKSDAANLFPPLAQFLSERDSELAQVPVNRRKQLACLADYVYRSLRSDGVAGLTFICTHNSRRSHLCQIWAKVAAEVCGLSAVETFSGGTEATAMNPRIVDSLRRVGFEIEAREPKAGPENPLYRVRYSEGIEPLRCFSKLYNEAPNPRLGYAAIMTCSTADEACPVVTGCDIRIPIRYVDPKAADDTLQESAVYDERSRQICREMLFVMRNVQSRIAMKHGLNNGSTPE